MTSETTPPITRRRVGPQMRAALEAVAATPGCPKNVPAAAAAQGQQLRNGYLAVDRCIKLGLIRAEPIGRGYRLTLTPAGKAELGQQEQTATD